MSKFKYTEGEYEINKVLKLNQDLSLKNMDDMQKPRNSADAAIERSKAILKSLGKSKELAMLDKQVKKTMENYKLDVTKTSSTSWENLVAEADEMYPNIIELEDILTPEEISYSFNEVKEINKEFSNKTGILNELDLSFLAVATGLQTLKALLYPYLAQSLGNYGSPINSTERLTASEADKMINGVKSVPYDVVRGSEKILDQALTPNNHRVKTLGHDVILGWFYGTLNILTNTITLTNGTTYRVVNGMMTNSKLSIAELIKDAFGMIFADNKSLLRAIKVQANHIKSDISTKRGLPVPVLSKVNDSFADTIYKKHYDLLCFERDSKFVLGSAVLSSLIDFIITMAHSMYCDEVIEKNKKLYEVRTRKIVLISNSIASTSSIIASIVTRNLKQLDIGGLITTIGHLFADIRFIEKLKQEFVIQELDVRLQKEINEIDKLYLSIV